MAIHPLPGYVVSVDFADGSHRNVQLADQLHHGLFTALKDLGLFNKVWMDAFGGAEWPNGADVAPEFLRWGPHQPHGCACGYDDPDEATEAQKS